MNETRQHCVSLFVCSDKSSDRKMEARSVEQQFVFCQISISGESGFRMPDSDSQATTMDSPAEAYALANVATLNIRPDAPLFFFAFAPVVFLLELLDSPGTIDELHRSCVEGMAC